MIRVQSIKKQLETFFRDNKYKYIYLNKKIEHLSVPMYLLRMNVVSEKTAEIEEEIDVMISVFSSSQVIYFDTLNILKANDNNYIEILKKVNNANNYAFPGKFVLTNDKMVDYRYVLHYENMDKLCDKLLTTIIESIPPAYFIFLSDFDNEESDNDKN